MLSKHIAGSYTRARVPDSIPGLRVPGVRVLRHSGEARVRVRKMVTPVTEREQSGTT
jgi:hypothetical protein